MILAAHAAIALGTLSGGWRIIHTMGSKITKLQPVGGFAAETAGAISLFTATHLGIPVSTTHTITGAIIGVGSIRRLSAVRWGVAGRIVWAWVLTIPAAAFISAVDVLDRGDDDRAVDRVLTLSVQLPRTLNPVSAHAHSAPPNPADPIVKSAPRLRAIGRGDAAAVQLDQVLDDRQAEAGAAGIALAARARLVDAVEALEDARQIRLRNAGPSSATVSSTAVRAARAPMTIRPRLGRVVRGVLEQVAQRVVQLGGVAAARSRRPARSAVRPRCCRASSAAASSVSTPANSDSTAQGTCSSGSWPASRRARRSRSRTSRSMRSVWRPMISRNRRASAGSAPPSSSAST